MKRIFFNKYAVIIAIITIVFIIGIIVFKNSNKVVPVNFILPEDTTLTIYRPTSSQQGEAPKKELLMTIDKSGYYTFNKGFIYLYTATGKDIYEPIDGNFVAQKDSTVDIKFNYSTKYLSDKLKEEGTLINNAIISKYPDQMQYYSLKYGKLYKDGSWFAGKLIPSINPDKLDVLQVVLHKENEEWKVVTVPDISLSKDVNPDVPGEILEELNIIKRDESMDREATSQ